MWYKWYRGLQTHVTAKPLPQIYHHLKNIEPQLLQLKTTAQLNRTCHIIMSSQPTESEPAILFRPSKKRKIYRQRAADDEVLASVSSPPPPPTSLSLDELISSAGVANATSLEGETEGELSIAEILRLRKKNKRGGVEFKASGQGQGQHDEDSALVPPSKEGDVEEVEVVGGIISKFARQTGAVGDVNRHM
jgi:hypothetical protein